MATIDRQVAPSPAEATRRLLGGSLPAPNPELDRLIDRIDEADRDGAAPRK